MATLGGYKFLSATGPAPFVWQTDLTDKSVVYLTGWMEYLPKQVAAAPELAQPERFHQTCACVSEHFHGCAIGWSAMRPLVMEGTRAAMEAYMRTQPTTLAKSLHFQPTDWLIYERCCVFCHKNHGFSNIHAYDVLPKEGSYTIYTLSPPDADKNDGFGLCTPLQKLRDEYILERNPKVRIVPLSGETLFEDFGRIVYAPNLLIPSTGTSFGLWAALANNGNVHMARANPTDDIAMYPMDLHILPVPFLDALNAAKELRMEDASQSERERIAIAENLRDSPEGKELIKAWFMAEDPLPVLVAD